MYLNTHTYYSLRYGTLAPRELLGQLQKLGVRHFALTDINTTSACWEILRMAPEFDLKVCFGVDFRNGAQQQFILLAENRLGFQQINDYLSPFLMEQKAIPNRAASLNHTFVIYPFRGQAYFPLKENEYLGIKAQDLNKLKFSPWRQHPEKLVALYTLSFQNRKGFNTHRLLRAIDNNTLLSKLPESEQGQPEDVLEPPSHLKEAFREFPYLLENAQSLLESCSIEFDFDAGTPNNQRCYTGNEDLDARLLRKLTYDGLEYRYGENPEPPILIRIEKELEIIRQKGFISYFLINWKIVKYARNKGYFYVGRGSGANSIVAYLLRITDVDPIELDLYFERFINLYRKNPPDFDIDFSWADRDDVTEFIFKRFKHTALLTVYNTFKHRAAVRELGKVFGLPKEEIDKLSQGDFQWEQLDQLSRLVLTYSQRIQGFPNYLGIHASGIIISEKPIHHYTATFLPPKGFPTTQFDMVVAEDIGLYKFDILSQRGLGKIKDAVTIAHQNNPDASFDIHDIRRFKEDEHINYLLKNAKAIGCFYVESPAMRMLLRKLQVDNYLGLVAASSVIRPGVSQSGMMREYILRYRFPERRQDAHPVLMDIMPETYGVMVYQEDVIKVAHYFGGLTLGEADMLRRGMSGKFRSREEFAKVKDQFFDNCKKAGKPLELVTEIWRQIESFAGYAFAKGHSASYAVESYQSLFLKAYYPLEYMVATLNNGGGFYRPEFYVHEARMQGGNILPPCVNTSTAETKIFGKDIYLGLGFLYALETQTVKRILKARNYQGKFLSLDDFLERVPISIEQISILIKVNAFRFTKRNKRELLWEAHMKIQKTNLEEHQPQLFRSPRIDYKTPNLSQSVLEDAFDEMELLGYPLCHPFLLLREEDEVDLRARDLIKHVGETVTVKGYLVTTKNTRTSKGERMYFGTFLDFDGDFIDTVHFPPVAQKYRFRGKGIYRITGKVMEEFDCITLEVSSMELLPIVEDPRYAEGAVQTRIHGKRYKNAE